MLLTFLSSHLFTHNFVARHALLCLGAVDTDHRVEWEISCNLCGTPCCHAKGAPGTVNYLFREGEGGSISSHLYCRVESLPCVHVEHNLLGAVENCFASFVGPLRTQGAPN